MYGDLMYYIGRLELIAFFSGYPLIYALVYVVTEKKRKAGNSSANKLVSLLPYAYALTGTLFLGLILKDMSPDYSFKNFTGQFQKPYLKSWGLISLIFWIPVFSKRPFFSLVHSLVFFFLIIQDIFLYINSSFDKEMLQNDMKVYTTSLLIITGAYLFIVLLHFFFIAAGKKKILSN